jgi:tetratricopeptide (TPR) repeat protein
MPADERRFDTCFDMDSALQSLWSQAQSHSVAGRRDEALLILKQLLAQAPAHGEALEIAGYLCRDANDFPQAADYMDAALAVLPATPARLREAAIINRKANRLTQAAERFEQFAALMPSNAETLLTVGVAWASAGDRARAVAALQRAIRLYPMLWQMHYNLGIVLGESGEYERELTCYDTALRLKPDAFEVHLNKAIALRALHRFDDCLASFKKAIQLNGRHAGARRKRAQTHMLLGDFAQGLRDYEYRWEEAGAVRPYGDRIWDGKADLTDKVILLYNEQGLGDTLHYVRFTKDLARRGARIILRVQAPLVPLFEGYDDVEAVFADGDSLPPFDFHIPLMSLPLVLNMTLATIPSAVPYFHAEQGRIAEWEQKLAAREVSARAAKPGSIRQGSNRRPRVGVVWSGNAANTNDRPRSTQLEQWRTLFELPAQFVSLQKDVRDVDRRTLAEFDGRGLLWDVASALQSYADTAALVVTLDLVIAVDTSVAHVSGALGQSTWIVLPFTPDPRWLLARTDSPWYPSATLFRQTREGDWGGVFGDVYQALQTLCETFQA